VHYVLVISYVDVANGQTRVKVQSIKGNASTTPSISPIDGSTVYTLDFKINNVVADGNVCVATYTAGAGQIYDGSPDLGCVDLSPDGSGGGGGGTF